MVSLSPPYISELITVKPKSTYGFPDKQQHSAVLQLCCYLLHCRKCCLHLALAPLLLLPLRLGTNCLLKLEMCVSLNSFKKSIKTFLFNERL